MKWVYALGSIFLLILILFVSSPKDTKIETTFSEQDKGRLSQIGYSKEEIIDIYEHFDDETIEQILHHEYVDLSFFYELSNFDFSKLNRYLAYQTLQNISMSDAVTRVNLNLDTPFYTDVTTIQNPSDIAVYVNKYRALPADYVPNDLTSIPSFPNYQIRQIAVDDFENFIAASKLDGLFILPFSAYRSYQYQEKLYQRYLKQDTLENVDSYSARKGHSEHQTGLAIDIRSNGLLANLEESDYKWVQENSYRYGFILRYPKNTQPITGYIEEPWHLRYVGKEHAQKIHELQITFDEYYDLYLKKKE